MGSIVRLVVLFGKLAITLIIVALVLYLSFLLVNRIFRYFIDAMEYEAVDLFTWVKERFPKLKKKEEKYEKPESRETLQSGEFHQHQDN